ncbi:hypothetical protein AB0C52_35770, partial [Streptomyces sp. NPDC048717]|uniref:hypothetical protein n=1 Tax=Streptomyces sp. NPDC048717 TaxID=3154928 RepID=UPI00343A52DD
MRNDQALQPTEHAAGHTGVHRLVARHQDHAARCRTEAPSGVAGGTPVEGGGRIVTRKAKRPG